MACSIYVSVVIPASGTGERMGIFEEKQFYLMRGKPLLCHTVDAFLRYPFIEKVIITSPINQIDRVQAILKSCKLKSETEIIVLEGGLTRHWSIKIGIQNLKSLNLKSKIVIIHDAVRPILPLEVLSNIINQAEIYECVGLTRPLVSTVISKDDRNFLKESLDRSIYFNSEMPQAFKLPLIVEAYDKCSNFDLEHGTECLQLVLKYTNVRAKLIEGPPDLWKVTYKKDLYALEGVLTDQEIVQIVNCENKSFKTTLQNIIPSNFKNVDFNSKQLLQGDSLVKFYNNQSLVSVLDSIESNPVLNRQIHITYDKDPTQSTNLLNLKSKAKACASEISKEFPINFICILKENDHEGELADLIIWLLKGNLTGQIFYL